MLSAISMTSWSSVRGFQPNRRQRLLDAATPLESGGIDALSLSMIARKAGVRRSGAGWLTLKRLELAGLRADFESDLEGALAALIRGLCSAAR